MFKHIVLKNFARFFRSQLQRNPLTTKADVRKPAVLNKGVHVFTQIFTVYLLPYFAIAANSFWPLSIFAQRLHCKFANPAGNYIFKVNNRNTRTRCEICSKSIITLNIHFFLSKIFISNAWLKLAKNKQKLSNNPGLNF